MTKRLLPALLGALVVATTASAATFAVRSDRDLVHRADAVVVATALASYSTTNDAGGIETVTPIAIQETIKGDVTAPTIDIVEPGGVYGGKVTLIAGVPQFASGRALLLFLMKTGPDRWSVLDLVVGKFTFAEDRLGQKVLVRDEDEIAGFDGDMQPHREMRRSAERFLDFVRAEARGGMGVMDYAVPKAELIESTRTPAPGRAGATALQPAPFVAPFTATSYTMTISGSQGSRWSVFPSGVSMYMGAAQEPGAPGGGATAVQAAINAWDNDCASNVNYVYAGADDGTHTQGLHAADGRNTVLFERDLSAWGIPPFSCGGGGTLGIGGITSASGSNTVSGETFATTQEADVEMNKGLANCSFLNSGDWNSAVTHEVGHTLGFRHADQNRASSGACSGTAGLECASTAIMTAFVTQGINAALQTWDQHAVQAVYPGGTCGGCTLPTVSISASSQSITAGQSVTLSSTTTGNPTSYQWYIGSSGSTSQPINGATGPSVTVTPSSTTNYWLRVTNSCGSANSNTVTITVSPAPPPTRKTPSDFNGDKRSDLVLQSSVTRGISVWLMNGAAAAVDQQLDVPPAGWAPATTGDLDGDGFADIIIRHDATSTIDAYLMASNGVSAKGFIGIGVSTANEFIVGTADFNRDGTDDILLHNPSNGQLAIWYTRKGNGGILTTALLGGAVAPWRAIAIGDVDGDGWPDVILQNSSTGQVLVWRTQQGNVVGAAVVGVTSDSVVVSGDVNGDGRDDIVLQNATTTVVTAWTMSGLNVTEAHQVEIPGPGWVLKGRGDFNGDGTADLVFQNSSTKTVQFWLLNNGRLSSIGQRPVKPEYTLMVNK